MKQVSFLVLSFCLAFTSFAQIASIEVSDLETPEVIDLETKVQSKKKKPFIDVSPDNFWVGGVLAYNFLPGQGTENVVGAAKIKLGAVQQFKGNFRLYVVGNFAKISSSSVSADELNKGIAEIVQSNQGLHISVAPVVYLNKRNKNKNFFRLYGSLGGKFNGYSKVGPEEENVTISQFRSTIGLEFEGWEIEDKMPFTLSTEFIHSSFSENSYFKVFGEKKKSLAALETILIVPVGGKLGFLTNYTVAQGSTPVFQAGIVLGNLKRK